VGGAQGCIFFFQFPTVGHSAAPLVFILQIVQYAINRDFTTVMVINENQKTPSTLNPPRPFPTCISIAPCSYTQADHTGSLGATL